MILFLGIDTSAYTSSIAVVSENGEIVIDKRKPLTIKKGERGLRQSEALFCHIKNLPELFKEIEHYIFMDIKAIAVSSFPRRVVNSYMPVFLAGLSHAAVLSEFNSLPLYQVSHQEGHIMAAITGNEELLNKKKFLAVHFSGGTSEILSIGWDKNRLLNIKTCFSGTDLHAGQLVDRIGVAMGLPFPAGRELEKLALRSEGIDIPYLPSAVGDRGFSFSGAETRALTLLKQGYPEENIAYAVFRVLANTLEKTLIRAAEKHRCKEVLLAGGVMANSLIKKRLLARLEHPAQAFNLYFARPELSVDNAVGVAKLAAILYKKPKTGGENI